MIDPSDLPSRYVLFLATSLALAVTFSAWYCSEKVGPRPPINPPSAIDVSRVIASKLVHFHGCPDGYLDANTMDCVQRSGWKLSMTIRCKPTNFELMTEMVRGKPNDVGQFEVVANCAGVSVVLWKPVNVAFGVREGREKGSGVPVRDTLPRIELMSGDPEEIVSRMCEDGDL